MAFDTDLLVPDPPDLVPDQPSDKIGQLPPSPTSRVLDAMRRGYLEGFAGTPDLLTPYAEQELYRLHKQGGITGGLAKLLHHVAEDVHAPLAVGPGVFRAIQAGVQQLGHEAGLPDQLSRDLAAGPEAFMGMPGALRTPRAPEPIAPRARVEPGFSEPPAPPARQVPGPVPPESGGGAPAVPPIPGMEPPPVPPARAEPPPVPSRPPPVPSAAPPGDLPLVPVLDETGKWIGYERGPAPAAGPPPVPDRPEPTALPPDLTPDPTPLPPPTSVQEPVTPPREAIKPEVGKQISGITDDGREITGEVEFLTPNATHAVVKDANGARHVVRSDTATAPAPVEQPAAQVEQQPAGGAGPAAAEPFGGPWTRVKTSTGEDATNIQGDAIYENANGLRALMDNGVPHTERFTEHPEKGLLPRDVVNRKGQFLTTEEAGRAAAPAKPKTSEKPAPSKEKPSAPAEPAAAVEKRPGETDEWRYLGENADGVPVFENGQGVHSTVQDGVRNVEPVRLRPTNGGMEMSVPKPEDKAPEFQVEKPAAEPDKKEPVVTPKTEKNEPKQPVAPAVPVTSDVTSAPASPESTPAEKPSTEAAKPEAHTDSTPAAPPVPETPSELPGDFVPDEAPEAEQQATPQPIRTIAEIQGQDKVSANRAKEIQDAEILARGKSIDIVVSGEPSAKIDGRPRVRTVEAIIREDGIRDPKEITAMQERELLALADWQADQRAALAPTEVSDEDASQAPQSDEKKPRDIWYVDHATPEELTRILGDKWVVAMDTPTNRKRHGDDAKFVSRKEYKAAQAQALADRMTEPERPAGWIKPGEVLWSKSGRQLSPVPRFNPGGGGQRRVTKKLAEWLVTEAQKEEPQASETRWLPDAIKEMDPSNLSNSDADLLRETLFGDPNGPLPANRLAPKTD